MRIAIVGAGVLGLSLAHYLAKRSHRVEVFEKNRYLGGLACSFDYGHFTWDKFYHVILAKDAHLLQLLGEIGLEKDLRWRPTANGYYGRGALHPLRTPGDLLRFPLLSWRDKIRMGLGTLYTLILRDPAPLYRMTSREWLIRVFGQANYTYFWRPFLRAKFGPYADAVAAIFMWASLKRVFGARPGYVRGGYHNILQALRGSLEAQGTRFHLGVTIRSIDLDTSPSPGLSPGAAQCSIRFSPDAEASAPRTFDKVIFTAPKQFAGPVLSEPLRRVAGFATQEAHAAAEYLGVVCLNLVLRRSLTPYYLVGLDEEGVPLTAVVEMTNLIDAAEETSGYSLLYLPRYLPSSDPFLRAADAVVYHQLFENGLRRLFPHLTDGDVVSWHVQRATHVQPVPLVRENAAPTGGLLPRMSEPFVLVNSSFLSCPTLNNNEIVGLAKQVASAV